MFERKHFRLICCIYARLLFTSSLQTRRGRFRVERCCAMTHFLCSWQYLLSMRRSWLRHNATSRKDAGSIPDGVIEIFHWLKPSGHTMALGSTQPLNRNVNQGYLLLGKGVRCVGLTTLPPSCAICGETLGSSTPGTLRTCQGL